MVNFSVSGLVALVAAAGSLASAASLTKVNNFGNNPTNAEMYIYVPDKLAANPPVLAVVHYCTGTANGMFTGTQYKTYADQHGFIVVYPDAPDSGQCWDVHSDATFKHDAGGDSLAIANMVRYALKTYNGDANRVFSVGISSGAMMTQVLMGAYPDLFTAGSAWSGVPFGCFAGAGMWNSQCAQGQSSKTAAQWGDLVRAAYPGYTGKRPKLQIWHGTGDDTLHFNNHGEAIKQWTNVNGVSTNPTSTTSNFVMSGWTKNEYGPNFQAITAQGQPHNVAHQEAKVIEYFGLNAAAPPPVSTTTAGPQVTSTTTAAPITTTTAPPTGGATVAKWGQCGGIGHTGGKVCVAGSTCQALNPYYSQCL